MDVQQPFEGTPGNAAARKVVNPEGAEEFPNEQWTRKLAALGETRGCNNYPLDGGFKHVLFSPLLWEMIQFDSYFSDGLKPPTSPVMWGLFHKPWSKDPY